MPLKFMHMRALHKQRGAIAIMVGLSLVTLIIALGLVVDLGHMFTAKTELQNAADACALAAVRELDGGADATKRATAAGKMIASYNKFDLQGDPIAEASVAVTFPVAQRAHCVIDQRGRRGHWFIQTAALLGAGGGSTWSMRAEAEAKLVPGMNLCAIPLAICTTNPAAPNRNFTQGLWYGGRLAAGTAQNGNYEWVRFAGLQGARDIKDLLAGDGMCDIPPAPVLINAEGGITNGVAIAWNTRFGLYAGGYRDMTVFQPDRTGFAYTPDLSVTVKGTWPSEKNAYADFLIKRDTYTPFDPASLLNEKGKPVQLPGSPPPISSAQHREFGADRRRALVPVMECSAWAPNGHNIVVHDWACVLMLSPIDDPNKDVRFEFLGLLSNGTCSGFGVPGGGGMQVPALVL